MAKILLIDDSPVTRELTTAVLSGAGHQLFEAEDGEKGMKLFAVHHPDLVITDIFMPEREGLGIIRELHAINPGIPVIAISASAPYLEIATKLGADRAFLKPLDFPGLINAVNELLG